MPRGGLEPFCTHLAGQLDAHPEALRTRIHQDETDCDEREDRLTIGEPVAPREENVQELVQTPGHRDRTSFPPESTGHRPLPRSRTRPPAAHVTERLTPVPL
ncbi:MULTISPECIES: hypothetical protein [unclassified Streptomyces]|uniref:hypothetical protein n=1 Tax=unclassified Streptomyces TaxID=2593676 RepID=UPI00131D68E9|nr:MULTISPECIES: hypothetical protein [unclassified Streptomyces]